VWQSRKHNGRDRTPTIHVLSHCDSIYEARGEVYAWTANILTRQKNASGPLVHRTKCIGGRTYSIYAIPASKRSTGDSLTSTEPVKDRSGRRSTYGLRALSSPAQTQLHRTPVRRPMERRMNGWDGHRPPTGRPPSSTILLYKSPK